METESLDEKQPEGHAKHGDHRPGKKLSGPGMTKTGKSGEGKSAEIQRQVEIDQQRGAAIGVKTTPTIFLNNEVVPPKQINPDELPAMVEAAMKKAKPSS